MLGTCPTTRMVPMVAEATPKDRRSTLLMMALVLGEEKSPKPSPLKGQHTTEKPDRGLRTQCDEQAESHGADRHAQRGHTQGGVPGMPLVPRSMAWTRRLRHTPSRNRFQGAEAEKWVLPLLHHTGCGRTWDRGFPGFYSRSADKAFSFAASATHAPRFPFPLKMDDFNAKAGAAKGTAPAWIHAMFARDYGPRISMARLTRSRNACRSPSGSSPRLSRTRDWTSSRVNFSLYSESRSTMPNPATAVANRKSTSA